MSNTGENFSIRFTPDIEISDADLTAAANKIITDIEHKVQNGSVEVKIEPKMNINNIKSLMSQLSKLFGKGVKLTVDTGEAGKKLDDLKRKKDLFEKSANKYNSKESKESIVDSYISQFKSENKKKYSDLEKKAKEIYSSSDKRKFKTYTSLGLKEDKAAQAYADDVLKTKLISDRQKSAITKLKRIGSIENWTENTQYLEEFSRISSFLESSNDTLKKYNKSNVGKLLPIDNNFNKEAENLVSNMRQQLSSAFSSLDTEIKAVQKEVDVIVREAQKTFETSVAESLQETSSKAKSEKVKKTKNIETTKNTESTDSSNAKEIKLKPDTSEIDKYLNTIKDRSISIKLNLTEDSDFKTAIEDINKLQSGDKTFSYTLNLTNSGENDISSFFNKIQEIKSTNAEKIEVDFNIEDEKIEKVNHILEKLKTKDDNTINFKIDIDTSEADKVLADLAVLTSGEKIIKVKSDATDIMYDLEAIERTISEIQSECNLSLELKTNQAFTTDKEKTIKHIGRAIKTTSNTALRYSEVMEKTFGLAISPVEKLNGVLSALNSTLAQSVSLAQEFKIDPQVTKSEKREPSEETRRKTEGKTKDPLKTKINSLKREIDNFNSKKISNIDVDAFIPDVHSKINTYLEDFNSLKDDIDASKIISEEEISTFKSRLEEIKKGLSEFTDLRKQKSYLKENSQGTAINKIDPNDFNENSAAKYLRDSDENIYKILNTSTSQNGNRINALVKTYSGNYEKYAIKLDKATGIVRKSLQGTNIESGILSKTFNALGREFQKLTKYLISMGALQYVWQGFKSGVQSVKEMQDALLELQKVTDETDARYAKTLETNFDTSKKIGQSAIDLTNSTADYARLGYSIDDSEELAKQTGILMNVSEFENMSDATDAMISMLQGFGKSADEASNIIDIMNAVGNNLPISTSDLASSLQRSASALSSKGVSIEQAAALTAAANSVVQNPESVGAGLRTIALRLTGTESAKNELAAEGEDVENMITSTSKLRDIIMDLTKVKSNNFKGFDILTNNGEYKDTYEILLGISKVWNEIGETNQGSMKQSNLLEQIAGKNRSNIAASLLEHPELLEKGYSVALNADGSALEENEKYLNSISGKIEILKTSLEEMWNNAIDSDFMKFIVDLGTAIINLVDKVDLLRAAFVGLGGFLGFKNLGRANYQLSSLKCKCPA